MRRHFTARVMNSNGGRQVMEVYGPPTFRDWLCCHHVFEAMGIMFDVVPGGPV